MSERLHVALIDDDAAVLDALQHYLARQSIRTSVFRVAKEFLEALDDREQFDCVVSDVRMPGMSGLDLMKRLNERGYPGPVILITGHGDIDMAVGTIKDGAFDFIEKPFDEARLLASIRQGAERTRQSKSDAAELEDLQTRFEALSARQREVMELAVSGLSSKGDRDQAQYQPEDRGEPSRLGHGADRRAQHRRSDTQSHEDPRPQGTLQVTSSALRPHKQAMSDLDAIIIGAGHNGLTCAAYLAMAGLRVRVFERRGIVGGACVTEEFHPGFRNSVASYTVSLLQPKIISNLKLRERGLRIVERRVQNFLPLPDDRYLLSGEGRTENEIAKFSPKDAARYGAYQVEIGRLAQALRDLVLLAPPNFLLGDLRQALRGLGDLAAIGKTLWRNDSLAAALHLLRRSAGDMLDRWSSPIRSRRSLASMRSSAISRALTAQVPRTCCCTTYSAR